MNPPDDHDLNKKECLKGTCSHIAPSHAGIRLDTTGIDTEIRRDYLHESYVLVAPNRGKRPYDLKTSSKKLVETLKSPRLDRNRETYSMLNSRGDWIVKSVENRFPSLTPDNPKAYGKQEIVLDTPLANKPFASLSNVQITNVITAFAQRVTALQSENGIEYVLVFHNDGYSAGASLAHAHSQIFALSFIPPRFADESKIVEEYVKTNGKNPFDDIIAYEKKHKSRVICENDRFIVFCPYASQWPFEFWIVPKRPIISITELTKTEKADVAKFLRKYCHKLCRHQISYNIFFQNGISANQRLCIKICGRSNIWGGYEVATGMVINTVPPESAAKWYGGK